MSSAMLDDIESNARVPTTPSVESIAITSQNEPEANRVESELQMSK